MSQADFLGRAIDTVKKAIETDTAGEYEKAYTLYYQACEFSAHITNQRKLLTLASGAVYARLKM
jgi:hypothetical protein